MAEGKWLTAKELINNKCGRRLLTVVSCQLSLKKEYICFQKKFSLAVVPLC